MSTTDYAPPQERERWGSRVGLILAMAGTAIGLVVGAVAPLVAATLAASLLPFSVPVGIYPAPLAVAALFGVLTAVAFSLWSLGRACDVKAAQLFRSAISPLGGRPRAPYLAALAASVLGLCGLAVLTATDRWLAAGFIAGASGAVALFIAASWLIMAGARRAGRPRDPELRMALASLHRPGAPTPGVVLALGLGLTVLVTIALIQANLSRQVDERIPEIAPAYFFIDIQPHQKDRFLEVLNGIDGVGEIHTTPMVRGRITEINGVSAAEAT